MDRLEGVSAAVLEPTTSMPLPSRDALTPTWTPPAAKPGVFLFAGGGTGGHLFPGVALAERIHERRPAARTLFVGSDRPIEQRIVSAQRLEHRTLSTTNFGHLRRRPDQFLWRNWQALRDAAALVQSLRPEVVFGLGGFASAPVVWAAYRAGVPVMLWNRTRFRGRRPVGCRDSRGSSVRPSRKVTIGCPVRFRRWSAETRSAGRSASWRTSRCPIRPVPGRSSSWGAVWGPMASIRR